MAMLASAETLTEDWVDVQEMPVRSKPADDNYDLNLYQRLSDAATERLQQNPSPIFVADLNLRTLYNHFLDALPEEKRQKYNCNTCRQFVRRYGGLALVDDSGRLNPVLWDSQDPKIDSTFKPAVHALAQQFEGRKVYREFKVTADTAAKLASTTWKGGHPHLHLQLKGIEIRKEEALGFARASTTELANMLTRVLESYKIDTVRSASQMLEQDKLPYANDHKAAAQWLLSLLTTDKINGPSTGNEIARRNLICRYAASAFTGCINQLRNGALSTLLDDIESGKPWPSILDQWKQKTNPIRYLRPQAAPSTGNIAASERLFNQLGITENDLRRRFLVLDDISSSCVMWRCQSSGQKQATGLKLFANVIPKNPSSKASTKPSDLPPTRITFTKLLNDILPTATRVEYKLATNDGLYFFITGHPNTKPLMQWHSDSNDNRASWYIYNVPKPVKQHNLKPNEWNEVKAIMPFPHLWDGAPLTTTFPLPHEKSKEAEAFKYYHEKHGFRYLLALDGIADKDQISLCLFPSLLKGEFHGARATIEAFSNKGEKEFVEDAEKKGGYVGGIGIGRSLGKSDEHGKHLIRITDENGARGVWEIVLFE